MRLACWFGRARWAALPSLVVLLGLGGDAAVPWPRGARPSDAELETLVAEAEALAAVEQSEEWLAAAELGEDSEHLPVQQEEIDGGRYDLAGLFRLGDELFSHEFRPGDGYGDGHFTALRRIHDGVRGGLDGFSCAGCHSVGGPDGAGSETQRAFLGGDGDRESSTNARSPPALLGLGIVQALGAEMSADLAWQRDQAVAEAAARGRPVLAPLESKGSRFGALLARPDGSVDSARVEGVDADLVVRPFGWKGTTARLRRFVEEAARIHFGIQSHVLALGHRDQPDPAHLGDGPLWYDPDGDGWAHELEEGALTAAAVYLALLETPVVIPPVDPALRERWAAGSARFAAIGCEGCHTRRMPLRNTSWAETADTTAGAVVVRLFYDGDKPRGSNEVALFSDLRRHAMGGALAERHEGEDGLGRDVFLTRPLWGLAESAPYLHDGRAATIPEAIAAHGGEAEAARQAYLSLPPEEQQDIHLFLLSLTREPKVRVAR